MELQGFKSFPDRTVLSFAHPLTAIVGPNGSGKSNLADAIRWVLGEQSAKTLRGGRMEDVIFGGTPDRKGQGVARVTLTLEQCQDRFPDGGEEISVTRRCYRSGESEYEINGQSVRLRDVTALFLDTGLGQEGYALIGQGRIDEVLSAKSIQRREMFEEAAGIAHCRHQKEETQRALGRTEENLLRLGDKLEELERQLAPLREQAAAAQSYLALREELRTLEISLWMEQLDRQRTRGKTVSASLDTTRRQLDECTQEAERLYAQGETLRRQAQARTEQLEALAAEIRAQETALQQDRQRLALVEDRLRANEDSAVRTRENLSRQQRRQGEIEEELARQQTQLVGLEEQEAALHTRIETVRAQEERLREQTAQEEAAWQESLRQGRETLEACRRREAAAEKNWMTLRMAEEGLAQRCKLLEELAARYEGYGKGVQAVMAAARRGDLDGVLGPAGELFQVDSTYAVALETALGGAMQHVLVRDEAAGKAVLRWLKKTDQGRVTCLPMTALQPKVLTEASFVDEPGYLAIASDLVRCEEAIRPAAEALLGRTVVVDHLDNGVRLAQARQYRVPVVTLEGEILRPGGTMTGGTPRHRGERFTRRAEAAQAEAQWTKARQETARSKEEWEAARRETRRAADDWEGQQKTGQTRSDAVSAAQQEQQAALQTLREELASLQGTRAAFLPLLEQLRSQVADAAADGERQTAFLRALDQERETLTAETAQLRARETERTAEGETMTARYDRRRQESLLLEQQAADAEGEARRQNDRQLTLQREVASLEQKKLQASLEENQLLDRLWDTYGVTHQQGLSLRVPVDDQAKARRRAAQLHQAIRDCGTVNLGAVEECARVQARVQEIQMQKQDVETARKELEGVIRGITREMEDIFRREFSRIQEAFARTFADLFGGGRGALVLEDENDVLGCGIDIRVQPPGKTMRSLSLLSGGERSLVAIALYFAMLHVHPTPFCVVDEIEAALDEANVVRFTRYLRQMARQTQFLLITHRRETMEAADVLYGVTMERQGISRVLRLDLHQAAALLEGGAP